MINIVDFWEQQIEIWNIENKCGLCWSFGAPLTESAVTVQQSESGAECCVQVFLVRDRVTAFSTSNNYNLTTSLLLNSTCSTGFELLFLLPTTIGTNNFNEIKDHPTSESKWSTIFSRLEQCISCDANIAFCEILGSTRKVTQWSGKLVTNYTPENYAGFRVTVQFQSQN